MIISCGSFQDTACGGGREGDAAAVQQLRWQAAPIPGCLLGGLVVGFLQCQLASCNVSCILICLHPGLPRSQAECEGGGTSFGWRDIMSKEWGAD